MGALTSFPLLAIPVIVYNIIAWGGQAFGGAAGVHGRLNEVIVSVPMASMMTVVGPDGVETVQRVSWGLTPGDLIIVLGLVLLFMELLKSTSTGKSAIVNHAFSLVLMLFCFLEFLLFAPFATSVFFILTTMCLLDVLAGFIVTIVTARRDIAVGDDFHG